MFLPLNGRLSKKWVRILLVAGLPLLGLGFSRTLKSRPPQADISCSDVVSLFRWGALHHGFGQPNFASPDFSKRVAQLFAEKMDPQRLLLVKTDIEKLLKVSEIAWAAVLEKRDCSLYQNWFQEKKQQSRIRFSKTMNQWLKTHSLFSKVFLKKDSQEFTSFAGSLDELSQRQEDFLSETVKNSHPNILESYRNKATLLFWEKFQDSISEPDTTSNSLLAKAALAALDPYSTYFSRDEFSEFYEELSGSPAGIGLEVQKTLHGLGVTEVLPGSPASKSGIQVGDEIIAINENSLRELNFKSSVSFLRGENASQVRLTLSKKGSGERTISLKRTSEIFKEQKVTSRSLVSGENKQIAFITIPSFYGRGGLGEQEERASSSSEDFQKQLLGLLESSKRPDAIVIDLRGNPGGYLEEAVAIAGFFLGPKPVVGVKDESELRVLKSDLNSEPLYTGPLLVAIDEETASAGEVLASALKDYQRAVIVGAATTFGKGSVQKLFQLDDPFLELGVKEKTGVVKLTTSIFFSPLGHSPANGGVGSHVVLSSSNLKAKKEKLPIYPIAKVKERKPFLNFDEIEKIKKEEETLRARLAQIETERTSGQFSYQQILEVSDQFLDSEALVVSN